MKTLSLDLETYSDIDISKSGVYKYACSSSFEILLCGVSVDDGPVTVYDLASGDKLPNEIIHGILDDHVVKWAFNASFERICLSTYLNKHLSPTSWKCSLVLSAYNGLPQSLEKVGAVLGLSEQKLKESHNLIHYFCIPCRPTKANSNRTRNLPEHAPDKWALFKKYNQRDVEVEMSIHKRLQKYPLPSAIWAEYHLSEEINDRGILIDHELVDNALKIEATAHERIMSLMQKKTGLENPNSVIQMKNWLNNNGIQTETLGKKDVASLIKTTSPKVAEVLQLRLQLAKSSVKKYQAMQKAVCPDGRCRGMFRFYGASRSGRFAGRLIQLQNLPQNHIPDLAEARALTKAGDYEILKLLYGNIPDVLSQLIRTAFIPPAGYKYIVSDFSAIEARVLSFLADETWRTDVFRNNGDIYCASASQMFHVPVEKHGINGHLRQKGKIAELALGYGGSVGALKAMGAVDMGIPEDELQSLVDMWRSSNPNIVAYWWRMDNAVKKAIKQLQPQTIGKISISCESGMLFITLPSGRRLSYVQPEISTNKFGSESVTYMGIDATKHWNRIESYGPKFVENIVQAISRDILCYAMQTLKNYAIVGHVHDELIIECPQDTELDSICQLMSKTPEWIAGLPLRADGYECAFYQKD